MGLHIDSTVEPATPEVKKDTKKEKNKGPVGSDLKTILTAIRKEKGDKTVVTGSTIPPVLRQPTGLFELDFYLGGGFPKGRYSIIYGPESSAKTNFALLAVAQAQHQPGPCNKAVFVNVEQTIDPLWSQKLGVNVDDLIVVQPAYGEEAVDLIDALIRADDVSILVVDSIAALISNKEIAKSTEEYDVGTSALLIKRLVNKLMIAFGEEAKRGHYPCVILINQRRFKPNVQFGDPECLHGDVLVNFVNGRSLPIRYVVENKVFGEVWAYNCETEKFIPAPIVSHHFNGVAKPGELLTVTSEALDTRNGVLSATVSNTHKFLLKDGGWKRADELQAGDLLVSKFYNRINKSLRQFLLGTGCGDLTLAVANAYGNTHRASMKIEDSENHEYARWKVDMLSPFFSFMEQPNDSGFSRFNSSTGTDLFLLRKEFEGCRHPRAFFKEFSWLGFALWIMDDANHHHDRYKLAIGRFKNRPDDRAFISAEFNKLGLEHTWTQDKAVYFSTNASTLIALRICQFVPPCMHYKLPIALRKDCKFVLYNCPEIVAHPVRLTSVVPASPRKYRDPRYFDIHVGGPNNYVVGNLHNGFVVHNTMPGGEAQRFLSSLTIRTNGKNILDAKTNLSVFKEVNVVVKKAKVPIRAMSFKVNLCVNPTEGLKVGETDSFGMVKNYLQQLGMLEKTPKGYTISGYDKVWPTQAAIQNEYKSNPNFAITLQTYVNDAMTEMLLVEEPSGPSNATPGEAYSVGGGDE